MSDYQPPLGRDASPARRRHMITFGHPYSCTPLLNAIFEFNRSPSHSEITRIMKQTGLKRKQLTSWFWRKRKELSDPQPSGSSQFDPPSRRPNSPGGGLTLPKSRVIKPYLKGYSKTNQEEEDDDYRPPGHPVIDKSSDSHGKVPTHSTRNQSTSIVDPGTGSPLAEKLAQTEPYSRSNSQTPLQGLPWTIPPDRKSLLVRCRLRPLPQRVLTETNIDDQNELIENEVVGNCAAKDPVCPSISTHTILDEKDGDINEAFKNPNSSSKIQPDSSMSSDASVTSHGPKQNDFILSDVNEPPPERVPMNVPCYRDIELHHFQLDLEMLSRSQEHSFSTPRRSGSRKTSWLTSDCRLVSAHNHVETISRKNSNNFRNCSGSSNPNTSNSTESAESIFWRVSQEEPNLSTPSNADPLSLGQEIHRWSEISNIDCASRYSSESSESGGSCCTNAAVEDYSALLGTSPTQISMQGSPTLQQGGSTNNNLANNDDEFRKNGAAQSFPTALRYTSNTYRPLEESNGTLSHEDEKELFDPTTSLPIDTSEIEDDPRLFMWEHDHQEFLNLMDWNPLGSFMNKSY